MEANKTVKLIVMTNEELGEITPIPARNGDEGTLSQIEKPASIYTRAGAGSSFTIPVRKALASPNSISVLSR